MFALDEAYAKPSIAIHWIRNCILSALVALAASLLIYGARRATGAAAADAGLGAVVTCYVAVASLAALAGAADAVLAGAVLQRVVPFLPVRAWIALHVVVMVVIALGIEMILNLLPEDAETPSLDELPKDMVSLLAGGALVGTAMGTVIGTLQSLVLRRAAEGTAMWIGCSIAALAVAMSVATVAMSALGEAGGGFLHEVAGQLCIFLGVVIGAPIMLPALRRLKSRPRPDAERYAG
jgi:hypothetical protein